MLVMVGWGGGVAVGVAVGGVEAEADTRKGPTRSVLRSAKSPAILGSTTGT